MLPQKPVSAVDCVNPSIEWTKRALLRPFTWSKWWRIGLIGAAVGELSSFGCNFNTGDWSQITRRNPQQFQAAASPFPPEVVSSIFLVLFVGITLLVFVHLYVASVLRFVYFDSVATGRFRIREGWSRWHSHGLRWFGFNLLVMLAVIAAACVIGLPIILFCVALYKHGGGVVIALLALIGIPILLLALLVLAGFGVMIKDFCIPMMALEPITAFEAFKRVIRNAWQRKGEHAGYVGIKIVLAIVFGVLVAIVQVVIMMVILVPIIAAIVAGGVLGAAHGGGDPARIFANPLLLASMFAGIVVLIFIVLGITAVVLAPGLFFFEAYVLTWFAQRYEPLWNLLYPAPPQPPPPPATEPVLPTEPPPLPAV